MKRLELPHQLADYLCPVNGLCDIYEWKTGNRIPDDLIFYSKAGFQLISQKRAIVPKMIFLGQGSIGKREYNFWKEFIGYRIISNEGKAFKTTLNEVKALLDNDIPTILFGLDMFYLPYHQNFYHTRHILGHVVLMVGYDETNVYVHDNSKVGVQTIPLEELYLAWSNDYIGISKKNAYFGIDMEHPNRDVSDIVQQGMGKTASLYLNSPLGFMGKRGIDRFIREFPTWKNVFSVDDLNKIYLHFIEYTGSILPELPSEISNSNSGIVNPHQASRDQLATALLKYKSSLGIPAWEEAANCFKTSGAIIEKIVRGFIDDIHHQSFIESDKYISLFEKLKGIESRAFKILLPAHELNKAKKHERDCR